LRAWLAVPSFALQLPAEDVPELAERFSYPKDDRACLAAGAAATARGHYTRDELMLICAWKTDRSKGKVASNSETAVQFGTSRALRSSDETKRIEALTDLAGVGVPSASALLYFAFPNDYPILDKRALASLGYVSKRTTYESSFWIDYLLACRRIAADLKVPIRTLDKALWQWSAESGEAL
jgi:hypothetical protein